MNNTEIADLLRDYAAARAEVKEIKIELIKAVVSLGISQEAALEIGPYEVFLDGYLVGQGVIQDWRKTE
jgi:hypothetical protein